MADKERFYDVGAVATDVLVWQALASVMVPGLAIHQVRKASLLASSITGASMPSSHFAPLYAPYTGGEIHQAWGGENDQVAFGSQIAAYCSGPCHDSFYH